MSVLGGGEFGEGHEEGGGDGEGVVEEEAGFSVWKKEILEGFLWDYIIVCAQNNY